MKLIRIEDDFTELKPVFTYDKGKIIKTSCEVYGWPNTDVRGKIMYDNTYFTSYKEAYSALLKDTKLKYPWRNWRNNMQDSLKRIKNTTGYLFRDIYEYLYSRIIQRAVGIFYFLVK